MKQLNRSRLSLRALSLQVVIALCLAASAQAFTYLPSNLDCLLCFRQLGTMNPFDLEVDLGSVTKFYAVPIGSSITITQYTAAQLANAMGNSTFENVQFSVCAGNYNPSAGASTNYPLGTMWVSFARSDIGIQSSPFARDVPSAMVTACSDINTLGSAATFYSGTFDPDPLANTPTVVAIPPASNESCENFIGPGVNSQLGGTFSQQIGQFAPSSFSAPVRSDFYVDYPVRSPDPLNGNATSGNVSLLGYFTFNPDGTMTFTRQAANSPPPPPPPQPTLNIAQANGTNTISFLSTNGATYTLFYTDAAGFGNLPRSSWTSAGSTTGDGTVKQFMDAPGQAVTRFYYVSAHN